MNVDEIPESEDSAAEDVRLVGDVLAGNEGAFAQLERKHRRMVSFLIRKMIRGDEDVEDITQDTFMKAYAGLRYYRPEYAFSSWLYTIASNRCIDYLRRQRFTMTSIDQPVTTRDGGELAMDPPDREPLADSVLLAKERAQLLRDAMASLPEHYQVVIRLRHEEELEYQEIADRLGHPLGTVKAHLFRARKLLYRALMQHGTHFEEYLTQGGEGS